MYCSIYVAVLLFFIYLGTLSEVGLLARSVYNSTIFLTWTMPFTLDIVGVDPDISYYSVEVNVHSQDMTEMQIVNVNETKFQHALPHRNWCYEFTFVVTPWNLAGRGRNLSITIESSQPRASKLCQV